MLRFPGVLSIDPRKAFATDDIESYMQWVMRYSEPQEVLDCWKGYWGTHYMPNLTRLGYQSSTMRSIVAAQAWDGQ